MGGFTGTVFVDANANGLRDDGSPTTMPSLTVYLLDAAGALVFGKTANVSATGVYSFAGLTPAVYSVQFGLPSSYFFAPVSTTTDSDADRSTGKSTSVVTVVSGVTTAAGPDAGIYQSA